MSIESSIFQPETKATYKIEIHFGKNRTSHRAVGALLCWESGKTFNGGGDVQMFLCGYKGCNKFFPYSAIDGAIAICTNCGRKQYVSGKDKKHAITNGHPDLPVSSSMSVFSLNTEDIATLLEQRWRELGGDADIYLKYHPTDIRYTTQVTALGPEKARKLRGLLLYPLKNIIKDTAAGTSIHSRFLALLRA